MSKSDDPNISSVEAAALYLSNGETMDPNKAVIIDNNRKNELNMDALQRAHLRRLMQFDFTVQIMPRVILVTDASDARLRTRAKMYEGDVVNGMLTNEKALDRLVDACARLKKKWDAAHDL